MKLLSKFLFGQVCLPPIAAVDCDDVAKSPALLCSSIRPSLNHMATVSVLFSHHLLSVVEIHSLKGFAFSETFILYFK